MTKLLLFVPMLSLTGCVPSIAPLYTDADVITDERLTGTWKEPKPNPQIWKFRSTGGRNYLLAHEHQGRSSEFQSRLVRLKEHLFLDLFPVEVHAAGTELFRNHVIGAHTFYKVTVETDTLTLSALDPNWLRKHLVEKPQALPHVLQDPEGEARLVITASTKQLQAFVIKHLNTKEAWSREPSQFERAL
jgi:hypothetical protein